jgi:hypothetical protein
VSRVDISNDTALQHALELGENARRDTERLQQQNVELADHCGYLQARLEAAEKQVLALTTPPEPDRPQAPWWKRMLGLSAAVYDAIDRAIS